jgi:hypothetical protein
VIACCEFGIRLHEVWEARSHVASPAEMLDKGIDPSNRLLLQRQGIALWTGNRGKEKQR